MYRILKKKIASRTSNWRNVDIEMDESRIRLDRSESIKRDSSEPGR